MGNACKQECASGAFRLDAVSCEKKGEQHGPNSMSAIWRRISTNDRETTHRDYRKLSQNRYAFSFRIQGRMAGLFAPKISTLPGKAFTKSITNFMRMPSLQGLQSQRKKSSNKAQGVYGSCYRTHSRARSSMQRLAMICTRLTARLDIMRAQFEVGLSYRINKNFTILSEYAFVNDRTSVDHNYSMADVELTTF